MNLTKFLLARNAEDEDMASRAAFGWGAGWRDDYSEGEWATVHADGKRDMIGCEDGDVIKFIARHDPACVLGECDARRYLVDIHSGWHICPDEDAVEDDDATEPAPCLTLRIAAMVYAYHPDYQPEWTP